jgi:uncharacterized protein (DUF1697 family)
MAELRSALDEAGLGPVSTYIQSGNLVVRAERCQPADISQVVADRFGVEVPTIVVPRAKVEAVVTANPFPEMLDQPKQLFVFFTQDPVAADALDDLDPARFAPDEAKVVDGVIYAAYPDGMARSKLTTAVLDRAAGAPTTARNWNTVGKLVDLLAAEGD